MLKLLHRPNQPYLRILLIIMVLATAMTGAFLGVYLLGTAAYDVEGLSLSMSIKPSWHGETIIHLAPLGTISASTHEAPLVFRIQLQYIGTDLAEKILSPQGDGIRFLTNLRENLPRHLYGFAWQQLGAAFAGALVLVIAFWRPRIHNAIGAAIFGTLIFAALLGYGLKTYDVQAFREPHYTGVISLATEIIPEPDELLSRLDEMADQTDLLVGNIRQLFSSVNSLSILGDPEQQDDTVKVLLVSDLQSNPVGVEFIKALARNFRVDLVIDAGDLTDLGTPLETHLAEGLAEIDLPYIFVPGNHDSAETIAFVDSMKNSIILDGQVVKVGGLNIFGNADPLSSGAEVAIDPTEWNKLLDQQADMLLQNPPEQEVDLVVVHNPRVARQLAGTYPLIATGHTHQQNIEFTEDAVLLNPGSSGAAGVRGLYTDEVVPYSAIILYIRPGQGPTAADTIKYDPLSDRFYMERKMLQSNTPTPANGADQPLASAY
jgi:predicted phosphodiesterase